MNACKQLQATDSMLYAYAYAPLELERVFDSHAFVVTRDPSLTAACTVRVCSKCLIAVNLDPTYSPDQKQKLVGEYNCYVSQKRDTTNGASRGQSATSTAQPGQLRTSSASSDTPRRRPAVVPFLLEANHSSSSSSPASSPTSYDTHGDGGEPKVESGDDYEKRLYDDDADGGEAEEEDEDGDWGDKAFLWKLLKKVENVDRYVLSLQMLHQVISFRQGEDPDADITPLMAYLQKLVDHMGRQLKSLSA